MSASRSIRIATVVASFTLVGCGALLGFDDIRYSFTGGGLDASDDGTSGDVDGNVDDDAAPTADGGNVDAADGSTSSEASITCPTQLPGPPMVPAGTFCIDRTEVTETHYAAFASADAAVSPRCSSWKTTITPLVSSLANGPVTQVDWCDAYSYCAWAGKRLCGKVDGGAIVRPTDVTQGQWYRACSRGASRAFPYGDTFDVTACFSSADLDGGQRQHPRAVGLSIGCVGGYADLFDMSGNVAEWTDDCLGNSCAAYGGSYVDKDGSVLRCTSAEMIDREQAQLNVGFRCCSP